MSSASSPSTTTASNKTALMNSPLGKALSIFSALLLLTAIAASVMRLSLNGWGAMVWLVSFTAMVLIRAPHAQRNRANEITGGRTDWVERLLLLAMFATMMALPLLQLATGVLGFANYALPAWATWLGALLQLPYLWLFWRSHTDLGRNWSPGLELRRTHELVTHGVYQRVRHPMYAAIWLAALTQPLLIHNAIAGLLVIPAFAAMWFIRVPHEEAMMRAEFGDSYDLYCERAGRLMPR